MCVPVSIGFGKTALVPARIEYSTWQMYVRERKHSTSTCGISTSGTWLPGEESATDTGPWMDHGTWDCPLESDGTGENAMPREAVEALHMGLWKNPGGLSVHVHTLEPQHQRYHEEPHKPMDRGDCQADHQYDRVTAHEVRALSASWGYNCLVALPDILSVAFWRSSGVFQNSYLCDMACIAEGMGHVDTGSSGGCTTCSGSRASYPPP